MQERAVPTATKAILLTGAPGSGKTTLLKQAVSRLPGKAGGFYTEEIREGGVRKGFKLVTLDGREGILAHVDHRSTVRLGKYHLDLTVLEGVGVESLRRAQRESKLVVIDEIGPMELQSALFRDAVLEVLDSGCPLLATIARRDSPYTRVIKARPDVTVLEVMTRNRESLVHDLAERLRSIE